jgi:tRNA (cmo5U34)-methyltransferase
MSTDKIDFIAAFSDPQAVARYTQGPPRYMPGFADVQRMAGVLLAERAPVDANVLVLGAGGGLELRAFADMQPAWRFAGVDPALAMLDLARRTVGEHAERMTFVHGLIDDAPPGPFDAATCLLTLHFLSPTERLRTASEIRRRLKRGAPFVAAHSAFPQGAGERKLWLSRYAAFAVASGADAAEAARAQAAVEAALATLAPEHDEAILKEAGFSDVTLFYAAFTWRGWVGYA